MIYRFAETWADAIPKAMLVTNDYVPDPYHSSLDQVMPYDAGVPHIDVTGVTLDRRASSTTVSANPLFWPSFSGNNVRWVVVYSGTRLLRCVDLGGPHTFSSGTVSVAWHALGVLQEVVL